MMDKAMRRIEADNALLECGAAIKAFGGAAECGDSYVVAAFPQGMLVAAVDGLGHGPEASLAAQLATAALLRHAGAPMPDLIARCHEALKGTRGAALSVACFRADAGAGAMEWIGIGNVDGVLLQAGPDGRETKASLIQRGGVVGYRLPPLRVSQLAVFPEDMLVFATDGIASDFYLDARRSEPPQVLAERLLACHGKESDDALVLVARYRGLP